jgi:hypothetical protein
MEQKSPENYFIRAFDLTGLFQIQYVHEWAYRPLVRLPR